MSELDAYDAKLFEKLCSFVVDLNGPKIIVDDHRNDIYSAHGIDFEALAHLENLGLIRLDSANGYSLAGLPDSFNVIYFDQPIPVTIPVENETGQLTVGEAIFTKMGEELYSLCLPSPNVNFRKHLLEMWNN